MASIGVELRNDLGAWICCRLNKGVQGQRAKAQQILDSCGVEVTVLWSEWELQRASELSIRACKSLNTLSLLD